MVSNLEICIQPKYHLFGNRLNTFSEMKGLKHFSIDILFLEALVKYVPKIRS